MKNEKINSTSCYCLSGVAGLRAASVLPVGEGKFTYKDYPPFADRPVDVHYYIPASGDVRRMPIVFVFEGADRGYTYLLKAWKQEAEKHKFMVFIPHFDLERFPLPDYQEIGVMDDKDHTIRPAEKRTPALVDKIFEYVRQSSGSERERIYDLRSLSRRAVCAAFHAFP